MMFATSLAIISHEFHGRERGTAFGIWGATVGAAVAIGPLVGGVLTTWAGWRWIFFVNLPIGVACLAGAVVELHESRDEAHGGFDLPGLLTFSGSAFAGVLALLRGNDWGWSSGRVVGLLAAAVVLLLAFAAIQLRAERPTFDLRLFRVPSFAGAQIVAFTISAAMFSQFLYLTLYIQNVLGYSPIGAGLRFLPLSLVSFVVAPIAGRLSVHVPVRFLLGGGLALNGLALLLMHGITPGSGWTTLLAGFLVAGIGIGLVNPPLASTAVERRAARAGRDGVGDQQHVPPGRDRDRDRGARRDLPGQDPQRARGYGRRVVGEGGGGRADPLRARTARRDAAATGRVHLRAERDPADRGDRRVRRRRRSPSCWCGRRTSTRLRASRRAEPARYAARARAARSATRRSGAARRRR